MNNVIRYYNDMSDKEFMDLLSKRIPLVIPSFFRMKYMHSSYGLKIECEDMQLRFKFSNNEYSYIEKSLSVVKVSDIRTEYDLYLKFSFKHQVLSSEEYFNRFTKAYMDDLCNKVANNIEYKQLEVEEMKKYIKECPYEKICLEVRHKNDKTKANFENIPYLKRGDLRIYIDIYSEKLCKYIPVSSELMANWKEDISSLFDVACKNGVFDYDIQKQGYSDVGYYVYSNSAYPESIAFNENSPNKEIAEEINDNLYIFSKGTYLLMIPESNKRACEFYIKESDENGVEYMYYTCKKGLNYVVVGKKDIEEFKLAMDDNIIDSADKYQDSGINNNNIEVISNKEESSDENILIVPEEVINNIKEYFLDENNHITQFEVVEVRRASNHPDDNYLYHVIGKNKNTNEYATWTSWNEKTKVLNHGHYNVSLDMAKEISDDYFFDKTKFNDKSL